MQIFYPPKTRIPLFKSGTPNSTTTSKPVHKYPTFHGHSLLRFTPVSSSTTASSGSPPITCQQEQDEEDDKEKGEFDVLPVIRRPDKGEILESDSEEDEKQKHGTLMSENIEEEVEVGGRGFDESLNLFAKKINMFEPLDRAVDEPGEKPLEVNLELWLYKAKVFGRKFKFAEADRILRKCILNWPEDGRPYVGLGKILSKQSKFNEARIVYETGCQATQGDNPYIWQCWAVLENKIGNVRRSRELFDAATAADNKHAAAWHGWAVLEIKQGNISKARNLLGKGLKYCGANEYIYQTLAMLEVKANRIDQARYLFQKATASNPKSCASWLAWAQLEMQQENNQLTRKLFEKAVQASPKNRYAWHVWAMFETNQGDIDIGRKLLKIGHKLNPRDPVLLQSLALLEYKHSTANLSRLLFRKASVLDPKHQPIWMAWGWMEWKEGNISTAKELYQKALLIDSTSETAARCLQAWGVLEQRAGNLTSARRLFRSSLNINSQSYITWMTWASFEEEQGNEVRAEEIRNLYFQQRTEVVDDASWVMGLVDIIDPAMNSIKRLINFDQKSDSKVQEISKDESNPESGIPFSEDDSITNEVRPNEENLAVVVKSDFDLDSFIKDRLSLDLSQLDVLTEISSPKRNTSSRRTWKPEI